MATKDNVELHLRVPRELKARLVKHLVEKHSPNLVPSGAISEFICAAVEHRLMSEQP